VRALRLEGLAITERSLRRFYFASQVTKEHGGVWPVDGDAHATAYLRLVQANEQLQWEQRYAIQSPQSM
jgi:hypothetical protein